jgi:hypothetical protein
MAFNASFINSYWGQTSPESATLLQTSTYRTQAYEFCRLNDTLVCSMLIFSSFDSENQVNWAINEFNYQVTNGACQDSFSPTWEDW